MIVRLSDCSSNAPADESLAFTERSRLVDSYPASASICNVALPELDVNPDLDDFGLCHAERPARAPMHDNRWADRPVKNFRSRRPHRWAVDVVKTSGMPLDTCALYIVLVDLPERWELKQSWIVRQGYAAEKRVRRMFNDMIRAGRMRMARRHGDDGKLIPGIYEIADEPIWLDPRLPEPVDNSSEHAVCKSAETAPCGEANLRQGRASEGRVDIRNSIVNPITDTGPGDVESSTPPRLEGDGRDGGRKSYPSREAERRTGGAKAHLPRKEPDSRPAKGSAMKGFASGEAGQTPKDRNIERMRERMCAAAGPAMANPRKAARLVSSLVQWLAQGFDFDRDILPAIADVSHRPTKPPGSIISWDYFTGAIRDRRGAKPASEPPQRRKLEGWTPVGAAFTRRR
jgi:hypothetical protein